MNKDSENIPEKPTYNIFGQDVTKEEFDNYRKTQHFPIRMEKYFPEWAENQSPTLSQEDLEERWWQLKDQVHALMTSFLFSYRIVTVKNDDFEGYLVNKAASLDRVEATFNQEVRQPVMDFKKSHPEVVYVNIALDKDAQPNVYDVDTCYEPPKSYDKEAGELTAPVKQLVGSDAEMVDRLINYIEQQGASQDFELTVKPAVRDYYLNFVKQISNVSELQERFKAQVSKLVAMYADEDHDDRRILVDSRDDNVYVGSFDGHTQMTTVFAQVTIREDEDKGSK